MKKWISLILCIALLGGCIPASAAPFREAALTGNQLNAALLLAGHTDDAGVYHKGMVAEESWNAEQLADYLTQKLKEHEFSVCDALSDLAVALEKMRTENPQEYTRLTSGNNAAFYNQMQEMTYAAEQLRQEMRMHRDVFQIHSDLISGHVDTLRSNDTGERLRRETVPQLQRSMNMIRQSRTTVARNAASWERQIGDWQKTLASPGAGSNAVYSIADWAEEVINGGKVVITSEVSTDTLYSSGSLMGRMSAGGSLLGKKPDKKAKVTVVDDNHFAIFLKNGDLNIEGGKIRAWIPVNNLEDAVVYSEVTNEQGYVTFLVKNFPVDENGKIHISVLASANGMQYAYAEDVQIKKGGVYTMSLKNLEDKTKPYFMAAQFNSGDMLWSERQVFYSPYNDVIHDISAMLFLPDGISAEDTKMEIAYYVGSNTATEPTTISKSDAREEVQFPEDLLDGIRAIRFTFSGKWKSILQPGKPLKLTAFGPGFNQELVPQLSVTRGVYDTPFVNGESEVMAAVTSNLNKGFAGLFELTLDSDLKYPVGGSKLSMDLPFLSYLPRVFLDLDGTLNIAYGVDIGAIDRYQGTGGSRTEEGGEGGGGEGSGGEGSGGEGGGGRLTETSWKEDHTWRNADQKEIDAKVTDAQKEGAWAAYSAGLGAIYDGIQQKPVTFFGSAQAASIGGFVVLSGRLVKANEQDSSGRDFMKCEKLSLMAGGVLTFGCDFTLQGSYFAYASFNATASGAAGIGIGAEISRFSVSSPEDASKTVLHLAKGATGITIMIRIQITLTIGLGIKGVIGASVSGYAWISITLSWLATRIKPYITVRGGAGIYVTVQLLFMKYRLNICETDDWEKELVNDALTGTDMLLHSMRKGEEEGDTPPIYQSQDALEPQSYPALIPNADIPAKDVNAYSSIVQYADVGGHPFLFTIDLVDGVRYVCWRNLENGKTGNLKGLVPEAAQENLQTYHFAVATDTRNTNNETSRTRQKQYVAVGVLATKGFQDVTITLNDQPRTAEKAIDTWAYAVLLMADENGGLISSLPTFYTADTVYQWYGKASQVCDTPAIELETFVNPSAEAPVKGQLGAAMVSMSFTAQQSDFETVNNPEIDWFQRMFADPKTVAEWPTYRAKTELTDNGDGSSGNMRNITECRVSSWLPARVNTNPLYDLGCSMMPRYALSAPGDSEDGSNELYHYMGYVWNQESGQGYAAQGNALKIDAGHIAFFDFYSEPDYTNGIETITGTHLFRNQDHIFYLDKTDPNLEGYALKGASVLTIPNTRGDDPDNGQYNVYVARVEKNDYGIQIPSNSFQIAKIGNTRYLYWLSTANKENENDPDVYRIMAVACDSGGVNVSQPFVLASFTASQDNEKKPIHIYLSDNGKGYYMLADDDEGTDMTADVYSFRMTFVTNLELNDMSLAETVVSPGAFLDTIVSLMNSGNTAISTFGLELVLEEDGKETVVETVSCDLLDSARSELRDGNGSCISSGEAVYVSVPLGAEPIKKENRSSSSGVTVYRRASQQVESSDEDGESFHEAQILPGAIRFFTIPVRIPETWDGTKNLMMRIHAFGTQTNWLNPAVRSANAVKGDPESRQITYAADGNGNMVRTDNAADTSHATGLSASRRGKYKAELKTDIHDLDVDYQIYRNEDGERHLVLSFGNAAETAETMHLYGELYLDDASTPILVNIPHIPEYVSNGMTHNVDLPISTLLNGKTAEKALLVIQSDGITDIAARNNEILITFPESYGPLTFVRQPESLTVAEGENASFYAAVTGGVKPYSYQWQVDSGDGKGWQDLPKETGDELALSGVPWKWTGRNYRLVVTDHHLNRVESTAARLTVTRPVPQTGDSGNPLLYAGMIAAGLLLILALSGMRKKQKN